MGTWEDCCFTVRPDDCPVERVESQLHEFIDRPVKELPDLPDTITKYNPDAPYWGRRDLRLDSDPKQVYLGGRTHTVAVRDAWREWVHALGPGDGLLSLVVYHEDSARGWGQLWEYDESAGSYRHVGDRGTVTFEEPDMVHYGEAGADAAGPEHHFTAVSEVRAARYRAGSFVVPDSGPRPD